MPTVDFDRLVDDLAYVERLVASSPVLQATKPQIHTSGQAVWVEAAGHQREARAWRHAVGGRIFPSSVDSHHVWRQLVVAHRVSVLIVEKPTSEGETP